MGVALSPERRSGCELPPLSDGKDARTVAFRQIFEDRRRVRHERFALGQHDADRVIRLVGWARTQAQVFNTCTPSNGARLSYSLATSLIVKKTAPSSDR